MSTVTLGRCGELTLPEERLSRHGLTPDRPIRLIATKGGLFLVPLSEEAMSSELADEREAWRELASLSWDQFPFNAAEDQICCN